MLGLPDFLPPDDPLVQHAHSVFKMEDVGGETIHRQDGKARLRQFEDQVSRSNALIDERFADADLTGSAFSPRGVVTLHGDADYGTTTGGLRQEISDAYVFHHEAFHTLYSYPFLDMPSPEKLMDENGADSYAILQVIKKYGADGIRFARSVAAERTASEVIGDDRIHGTATAIEKTVEYVASLGSLDALKTMRGSELVEQAHKVAFWHTRFLSEQEKRDVEISMIQNGFSSDPEGSFARDFARAAFDLKTPVDNFLLTEEERNALNGPWSRVKAEVYSYQQSFEIGLRDKREAALKNDGFNHMFDDLVGMYDYVRQGIGQGILKNKVEQYETHPDRVGIGTFMDRTFARFQDEQKNGAEDALTFKEYFDLLGPELAKGRFFRLNREAQQYRSILKSSGFYGDNPPNIRSDAMKDTITQMALSQRLKAAGNTAL